MAEPGAFALGQDDPPPVLIEGAGGGGAIVLSCEHGGRALPGCLAHRAPAPADMDRHIAWDVGAAETARRIAERLAAPLALQPYSRLVVDSNRPRHAADLAPPVSDGTPVPFNQGLDEAELDARWSAIHQRFHRRVGSLIAERRPRAFASIHSFTPQLRGGAPRPMAVGLLVRRDPGFAQAVAAALGRLAPEAPVAMNAPYAIEDDSDYTIPVHGEGRGLPHVLVEIRNDLIADRAGISQWGALIASALAEAVAALGEG